MQLGLHLSPQHRINAAFAIYSFSLGNIFPRLPDLQHAMGVAEGAFGLGLIGTPVGTLLALTFATPILERIGFRLAVPITIVLVALGFAIASHAPNPLAFFLMLVPVGLMVGSCEIMLNVEADRTEFLVGKRIMNRAHSFWSLGFFGAGVAGGGIAHLGISPQLHLALIVPVSAIVVALCLGRYEPSPKREVDGPEPPRFARPTWPILVLVAATLSAVLMEGASLDWSAIYMRNVFESGPLISGLAVAAFAFSQGATRFFADSFVDRYSPPAVARALLVVLGTGILVVYFSPFPSLSLAGFVLVGIGAATMFPLAISAAAQRTDRDAATNVAALSQISFVILLLGPPLLGFVAEHFGIRVTFGIGLPFVLLSFLAAGSLAPRGAGKPPHGDAIARASAHQDSF